MRVILFKNTKKNLFTFGSYVFLNSLYEYAYIVWEIKCFRSLG